MSSAQRVPDDRAVRRGRPPLSDAARTAQRLEISRVAVDLFRRHGVDATTGDAIARAAGVSERTLWRWFRGKEACVEPLLSQAVDSLAAMLRSWPVGVDLAEHLRDTDAVLPGRDDDREAVLAVVRLTRDEPGLRAVWLVLAERAEPAIAASLAARWGRAAAEPAVRVRAAAVNAALRVVIDDIATESASSSGSSVGRHRDLLARALRELTEPPGDVALT